jgi:hypothetical protein
MWQLGERLQNLKRQDVLYTVIDSNEENYLLITKPMSVKVVIPKLESERPEWIKYKGEEYVQHTIPNNEKSIKKKRRNETSRPIPKRSNNPASGNKSSGTPAGGSVDTPSSGKSSPSYRRKTKKKGFRWKRNKPNSNKNI